jgi:hypothetical protein
MSHCILGAGKSSSVRASRAERDEVVGEAIARKCPWGHDFRGGGVREVSDWKEMGV